jgi:hypothetical protein
LACLHSQTSQSFLESALRLEVGLSAIKRRMHSICSPVISRPRYRMTPPICYKG